MIYSGLEFVQFFEFDPYAPCYNVIFAIVPAVHMTFTFLQLYFIFLNSKVRIDLFCIFFLLFLMTLIQSLSSLHVSEVVNEVSACS